MKNLCSALYVLAAEAGGQPAGGQAAAPGAAGKLLLPVVLVGMGLMLWLTSRSQRKREQKRREMMDSLKVKDDVITIGGIHGRIVSITGDQVVLRVDSDKDVRITMAKSGISRRVGDEETEQ
jgi:preprotein translocase subunit YajC